MELAEGLLAAALSDLERGSTSTDDVGRDLDKEVPREVDIDIDVGQMLQDLETRGAIVDLTPEPKANQDAIDEASVMINMHGLDLELVDSSEDDDAPGPQLTDMKCEA